VHEHVTSLSTEALVAADAALALAGVAADQQDVEAALEAAMSGGGSGVGADGSESWIWFFSCQRRSPHRATETIRHGHGPTDEAEHGFHAPIA
jgi:hypothetical protein